VDGSQGSSEVFYINCTNEEESQNAEFNYVEGKDHRKNIAFAVKDIKLGEEIFASHG
jgi:SET domain-containing protein